MAAGNRSKSRSPLACPSRDVSAPSVLQDQVDDGVAPAHLRQIDDGLLHRNTPHSVRCDRRR